MNKRDAKIFEWVRENRPDCLLSLTTLLEARGDDAGALRLLLYFGFEAGRQFQKENPTLELNDPSQYL